MKYRTHLITAAVLSMLSAADANADMPEIQAPVLSAPSISMPKVDPPQLSVSAETKSKSGAMLRAGTETAAKEVSGKLTAQALLGIAGSGQSDLLSAIVSGSAAAETAGLSGINGAVQTLSNTGLLSAENTNASVTNTLLLRILEKLDSLDSGGSGIVRQETPASSAKSDAADSGGTSGKNTARNNANTPAEKAVVRFRVNGYDILPTCKTIYCSQPDESGAFLLTGDREYRADGKRYAETFYFLFRGGTVSAAIMQEHENPNSFLYRIARNSPLPSETAGSIVSVLYSADKNSTEQTPLRLELLVNPPRK